MNERKDSRIRLNSAELLQIEKALRISAAILNTEAPRLRDFAEIHRLKRLANRIEGGGRKRG